MLKRFSWYIFALSCCFAYAHTQPPTHKKIQQTCVLDPTPYLLPQEHSLRPILDKIFSKTNVIANDQTFQKAGFKTLFQKGASYIRVATHPLVKGYIFKLYLDSEQRYRHLDQYTAQDWLIRRCIGASQIKELIKKHNIKNFVAPDKWLYEIPADPSRKEQRTFVLLATYLPITSSKESSKAWKAKITKDHLDELYIFIKEGRGSGALALNVPYTRQGTFAFIDTEYPDRELMHKPIERHFSKNMQKYWIDLKTQALSQKHKQK